MISSTADLHIHTTYSDGMATVPELLTYVATHTDLRVIAVTDHDAIAGALEAQRLAPDFGLEVVVGEEISTREGHLLALYIEAFIAPGRPVADTIAEVRAQGGLAVAAHPFQLLVPSLGRIGLLRQPIGMERGWTIDAVETFNAGTTLQHNNRLAERYACRRGLPLIGGSDAHHLGAVGRGFTRFPGRSAADLHRAILAGQTEAGGCFWGVAGFADVLRLRARRTVGHITLALPAESSSMAR
jgi:predicted metal-dependent phosphoesterase TrpH